MIAPANETPEQRRARLDRKNETQRIYRARLRSQAKAERPPVTVGATRAGIDAPPADEEATKLAKRDRDRIAKQRSRERARVALQAAQDTEAQRQEAIRKAQLERAALARAALARYRAEGRIGRKRKPKAKATKYSRRIPATLVREQRAAAKMLPVPVRSIEIPLDAVLGTIDEARSGTHVAQPALDRVNGNGQHKASAAGIDMEIVAELVLAIASKLSR